MSGTYQLDVAITKRFHSSKQNFLLDVTFSVAAEIVAIFGPSGSGKTTILECISGLMRPDSGYIALDGRLLLEGKTNIAPRDRNVGYVFQTLALFPHMTAAENIAYGLVNVGSRERARRVSEVLEAFHIADVSRRRPAEMSGGERQRVALARSLVTRPKVLLLDEPMSALDHEIKAGILRDLRHWHTHHQIAIIYVTHAVEEVFAIADRVLRLAEGKITGEGKPQETLMNERDRMIQNLQWVNP